MKSTYKLLGVFWDKRKMLEESLPEYTDKNFLFDYRVPLNLFDFKECVRSIRMTELLKSDDETILLEIVGNLNNCDKVVFLKDYDSKSMNPVIQKILEKRCSQIMNWVCEQLSQSSKPLLYVLYI